MFAGRRGPTDRSWRIPRVVRGFSAVHDQARLNELANEVPATIISSAVQETPSRSESSGGKRSYWPEVEFSYEYGGETRTSKQVWPVAESGPEAEEARRMWLVFVGAGLMALAPLAAVPKARSLHRLYRQAQGS